MIRQGPLKNVNDIFCQNGTYVEKGFDLGTMTDMHCPELPQEGDNFWSKSCVAKQLAPNGACSQKICENGAKAAGRSIDRDAIDLCLCGDKSLSAETLEQEYNINTKTCLACAKKIKDMRVYRQVQKQTKK